jgi:hypothetical protein
MTNPIKRTNKLPRQEKVENGCLECLFYRECDKYEPGAECKIVKTVDIDVNSIEALDRAQDDIINNANKLLKRAEVLSMDGTVGFGDVDRLRRQVFDMLEKRRKTISNTDIKKSAASTLGL